MFKISPSSAGLPKKTIHYRSWKSINLDIFREDISQSFSGFHCTDVESGVKSYAKTLEETLNKHAPEKTRDITVRTETPWYNSDLTREKQLRRTYERKYKKSNLQVDYKIYTDQRDKYNNLLNETKKDYYKSKIKNSTSSKDLFKTCNFLLNRSKSTALPTHECATELANRFVDYFGEKIRLIREDLDKYASESNQAVNINIDFEGSPLHEFRCVTPDEVKKIILSSPTKSCSLDPIPTWLLKQCTDQLVPVFTLIINTSLECADFSPELKRAFVTPLLKKAILDSEILKNYRPVSNLSFLSKLIERIVCVQLVDHLKQNNLYEVLQSAYRQQHSTETALLRVQNDLLQAVDKHGGAILVLLDLSAAFDTIDHSKLLETLEKSFGISGSALQWVSSYLTDRTQTVQVGEALSEPQKLKYGVPQGSVLGPILFTIYTTPLGQLIRSHGLSFHLYADDTQLYLAIKPSDATSTSDAKQRIEACVSDIRTWMKGNFLKLNDDKTEVLVITTKQGASDPPDITVKVGDQEIPPSDIPPRNLGVTFDSTLSLKTHVANVCKSLNYNIYSIGKIRKYLDRSTAEKMVNATITSRLDYCNSLLYGIPDGLCDKLQMCQNNAARVITGTRKFDHIKPVRVDLHWLPVKYRIMYKIMMITYKAQHDLAPQYISDLLTTYAPERRLRSGDNLLCEPSTDKKTYGDRAFAAAAPKLWNLLPVGLRDPNLSYPVFKTRLKTYYFTEAYFKR